jgi:hypothetical protein
MRQKRLLINRFSMLLLCVFLALSLMAFLFTMLPVKWPDTLPDGAYVKKERQTDVRIQLLAGGLPIDNVLPYVFSQYLLRGVDFRENAPILPGQPVANRTPLMSLVTTYIYGVLQVRPAPLPVLPKFSYVGSNWPDYRVLYDESMFNQFLVVGICLNVSMLLAAGTLARHIVGDQLATVVIVSLSLSPMVLVNSFYTWPKLFAAFGFLLAFHALLKRFSPVLVAGLLALSFYAHPMGGPFALGLVLLSFIWYHQRGEPLQRPLTMVFALGAAILPWILWSRFGAHSYDNLFSQNWHDIPSGWGGVMEFYTRIINYSRTVFPYGLSTNPPDLSVYDLFSWPGAMGLILYYLAAVSIFVLCKLRASLAICLIAIPFLIISIPFRKVHPGLGVYSSQLVVPLLVIAAVTCLGSLTGIWRVVLGSLALVELLGLTWLGFKPSGVVLSSIFNGRAPFSFYLIIGIQLSLMVLAIVTLYSDKGHSCDSKVDWRNWSRVAARD